MKKKIYSLTIPQKSILVTEQFYKGTTLHNVCGTAFMKEKINFNLLQQAILLFVKYNDSFRLKLSFENNEIKQYLDEFHSFSVPIIDLKEENEISNCENDLVRTLISLESDLFLFQMFRLPNGTGGFMANVHHIIADSWTLGLLAKEIVHIYCCLKNKESISSEDFPSYLTVIESEKDYQYSEKFEKDKEYWNSIFDTIPEPTNVPSTKPITDTFSCQANRISYMIPKEEMDLINEFCRSYHISVFNFFMAIYSIYLGRVSHLKDFTIGTPILNRTNFKEKNTTGMFINIVPCRIQLTNSDFVSFVQKIAKDSLCMLRHQKYSYQYILEDLRKKSPDLPSLYHTIISYQITKANTEKGCSYDTTWAFNGNCGDDLDIHLFDLNDSGSINIAYDYQLNLYSEEDIASIHGRVLHMIKQVLAKPTIALEQISIITSKEKYQLLYGFNNSELCYDDTVPFISFFEKQVEQTPNRPALTFEGNTLTYEQLNKKANSLSHLLRTNGVSNNTIVGVMMNRSLEMIISLLAILKSGGSYIPIDPEYPKERIDYMLKDSRSFSCFKSKIFIKRHSM